MIKKLQCLLEFMGSAWFYNRYYWKGSDELVGLAYFETPSSGRLHGKWWKTRDYTSPPKRFWEKYR